MENCFYMPGRSWVLAFVKAIILFRRRPQVRSKALVWRDDIFLNFHMPRQGLWALEPNCDVIETSL